MTLLRSGAECRGVGLSFPCNPSADKNTDSKSLPNYTEHEAHLSNSSGCPGSELYIDFERQSDAAKFQCHTAECTSVDPETRPYISGFYGEPSTLIWQADHNTEPESADYLQTTAIVHSSARVSFGGG